MVHEQGGLRCIDCNAQIVWPAPALVGSNIRAQRAFLALVSELHAACDPAERVDTVMELVVFDRTAELARARRAAAGVG